LTLFLSPVGDIILRSNVPRKRELGGIEMSKPNLFAPVTLAIVGCIVASIEPAFAADVPAPIVGVGLPAFAILGGGYWLIKKLRERRKRD
jgi:hypothetical protein